MIESNTSSPPLFNRAVRHLLVSERTIVLLLLAALIATAWAYLIAQPHPTMPDYEQPFLLVGADVYSPRYFYLYSPLPVSPFYSSFLAMWLIMIAAMMLPTAAPTILAYLNIVESGRSQQPSQQPFGSSLLFLLGYLLVWAIAALAGTYLYGLFPAYTPRSLLTPARMHQHVIMSAGVLLLAGLYQLSTWKDACLRECQSPMRFFLAYWREGYWGALHMGLRHGLSCLGCCWALMAVMYVVGVMNLIWMALLGMLMLIEKVWKYGHQVSKISGVGFIMWGVIVLMYHFI